MKSFLQKAIAFFIGSPAKNTAQAIGVGGEVVDEAYVELKNNIHRENFKKIPKGERLVFIPHCLRKKNCKAKQTEFGYKCVGCSPKDCQVFKIKKRAKELGYKGCYIVPGGSVIPRIIRKEKPKAAIGIACFKELGLTIPVAEKAGLAGQAVPLKRDGCMCTEVDLLDVFEKLEQ